MGISASSLFGTQSVRIQEVINKTLDFLLPATDPFWRDTIATSQGVGKVDELGRDLKILKVFHGSLAGVIQPAGPKLDFINYGDPLNQAVGISGQERLFLQGNGFGSGAQTFPDPLLGPNPKPFRLGVPMRGLTANIALTMAEMTADVLPATIGQIVAPKMVAFARHMTHYLCLYWYLDQNSFYKLCDIPTGVGTYVNSNKTLRFSPANLAVHRFQIGLRVDIYDATGATQRNAVATTPLYVTRVDELKNVVEISSTAAINGLSIVATDVVVLADSKGSSGTPWSASPYYTGIAGINSWLKYGDGTNTDNNANCLLGDERDTANPINVNIHGEFKSFYASRGGDMLTEQYLRKVLARFHAAKRPYGQYIDCLVASEGVWLGLESTKIGREIIDRTGRLSSLNQQGSEEGMKFSYDGRSYEGYTSSYIETGTLYGIRKGGNNWKKYVPPSPKGTQKMKEMEAFAPFEFVGGLLTGTGSAQIPLFRVVNNANLVTEFVQMPGMLRMQLVPDQPAGLKIVNCGEDRIYADN